MACFQPFVKKNRYGELSYIPCGWCINCRIDKRNQWVDRANYEFSKKVTGTFLTLTYDELNIIPNLVKGLDDKLRATINYNDLSLFIQRLRKRVKYLNRNTEKDNILFQSDFSYVAVGEYGHGNIPRPHFHLIILGLDFKYCSSLFREEWNKGYIYSLPIKNGAIRYVLKYIDKQVHGGDAKKMYDDFFLVRPKLITSRSFGSDLYLSDKNYIDIKKHNYTYLSSKNIRRPIPRYYLNKLRGARYTDDSSLIKELNSNGLFPKYFIHNGHKIISDKLDKMSDNYNMVYEYLMRKNSIKMRNEVNTSRNNLVPVYGSETYKI